MNAYLVDIPVCVFIRSDPEQVVLVLQRTVLPFGVDDTESHSIPAQSLAYHRNCPGFARTGLSDDTGPTGNKFLCLQEEFPFS